MDDLGPRQRWLELRHLQPEHPAHWSLRSWLSGQRNPQQQRLWGIRLSGAWRYCWADWDADQWELDEHWLVVDPRRLLHAWRLHIRPDRHRGPGWRLPEHRQRQRHDLRPLHSERDLSQLRGRA